MPPELDDLLDQSAPPLIEPDLDSELPALVTAARMRQAKRRGRRRAAVLGAFSAAIVVGGGTAAAAAGGWAPWAEAPLGSITYTLPSGGVCDQRVGNLHMRNHAAQTMIQKWLGSHSLSEIADVKAALAELRAHPTWWKDRPVGYGTAYYDADYEYTTAVQSAVSTAVDKKLTAEGYAHYDYTWDGETQCSGANQSPDLPWWATK